MSNKVGVIGGLGPMATAKFLEIIINNTKAEKDQDHVDLIVCQYSSIPDRTAFILDDSKENPVYEMIEAAKFLEKAGVSFITMPCNTATYFYEEIKKNISVEMINIVLETVNYCKNEGFKKVGLIATDGTIKSGIYEKYADGEIDVFLPNADVQKKIMSVIYDDVKQNIFPSSDKINDILEYFKDNGCDAIIAGCTEISVALDALNIHDDKVVDSLTVLAKKTILKAGKEVK